MSKKVVSQTKVSQKSLPASKSKATVRATMPSKVPIGKVVMTSADVKQLLINYQDLKKKYDELLAQNQVLEKTLMSAGIEVDEKFGDNEDHVVVPTMESVKGYTDLDKAPKTKAEVREHLSMEDDGPNGFDEDFD